ncbi:MAG: hypothetical protein F9K37_00265 [Bacteroidales bacterium]|nr:MAG: hypothetical protein F9K37_00265 [Bacteroidales bacterium]
MRINKYFQYIVFLTVLLATLMCNRNLEEKMPIPQPKSGKLFIIGGEINSTVLIDRLIKEAGLDKSGYVLMLSHNRINEDCSINDYQNNFKRRGIENFRTLNLLKHSASENDLELIRNASLIIVCGGEQSAFLNSIQGVPVKDALYFAYKNGASIAGANSSASIVSKTIITGKEIKHKEQSTFFSTIEANNVEISEGLGFIDKVIIDEDFIKKRKLNRLISVCLENPQNTCIGIDESAALIISQNCAEVIGEGQVIVIKHPTAETKIVNGLLGAKDLTMSVYLPGDTFNL